MNFITSSETPASLGNEDWFVLTLQFDTGEQGMYFVTVPKK